MIARTALPPKNRARHRVGTRRFWPGVYLQAGKDYPRPTIFGRGPRLEKLNGAKVPKTRTPKLYNTAAQAFATGDKWMWLVAKADTRRKYTS